MALTTETTPGTGSTARVIAADPATLDWAALRELYPEDDSEPMSDNTRQFRYIQTIAGGLDALFLDDPDVFVAGNLLWYAVEGQAQIRLAPDAMVVFGRPKGDRGSYLQWLEGGIAPQVVFEVLSPHNTGPEMAAKRRSYEQYGAEECYEYDPDPGRLRGWRRQGERLDPIREIQGWVSPRLGVRFELEGGELRLLGPDGRAFVSYAELQAQREAEQRRADLERERAATAAQEAAQERQRAARADLVASAATNQAERERQRAERLAARLRELGIDPET